MNDGAVVASAECVADLLQRMLGELAGQVHGDLPGQGDIGGPAFACHVTVADLVMVGHALLDGLERE